LFNKNLISIVLMKGVSVESHVDYIRRHSRRIPPPRGPSAARGALPRPPRAVLFDLYGTLFSQSRRRGWSPFSRERAAARFVKRHRLETTAAALAEALRRKILEEHAGRKASGTEYPEVRIERIWSGLFPGLRSSETECLAIEWELAVNPIRPMRGSAKLLEFLRARGTALGIVSNAQFYTPLFFEAFFGEKPEDLGFRPDLCIYSFELGVAKPQSSLFELAARRLEEAGIGRRETLMVGNDPANDIAPAASCGFMTALIADPRKRTEARTSGAGPDVVAGSLTVLQTMLA
jgi:putative hydrolase of the HAD superfamily